MRILLLGPDHRRLNSYLKSYGEEVVSYQDCIDTDSEILTGVEFIISYGYQMIINEHVIELFSGRVINLHISLLPWNRGRDPNLWSFLEDTPKGVSIHRIDRGVDTGDILGQREVVFDIDETLRSSYAKLSTTIEQLFIEIWPKVREGKRETMSQEEGGSYHRGKDKQTYVHLLHSGWDTPVSELIGKARQLRASGC